MGMLLQLDDVHKAYGSQVVLDGASVIINSGQKIGVIGRNGAGKSTLCKIITGDEEPDGGTIRKTAELRLAYLQQHDPYTLEETVLDFLMRHTAQAEWQCAKMAASFQLNNTLQRTTIGELSGGYRTRVKLAAMLLEDPNFLILDEPTNYLDLKTLMLLENFLQEYSEGFLIVSHDREFLIKTCEYTLEVETGSLALYPGSVEDYLIFKEEQREQAESYNRNIEAKQKQLQLFVDRFKAKASKAAQARSKAKQIERLKTIEIGHSLANVHIKIPPVPKRQGIALRCLDLSIGYPDKTVATKIHIEVPQGAHVAVLGDNGQGKTTFLRTIAEDLKPIGGDYRWGHNLQTAYYAQHVFATLDPKMDVVTYLSRKSAHDVTKQEVLNLAGSFLFKGADVEKKIAVLSGGERARLVLAGMLLSKSQVLLLDEPTNHLDFETVEALGNALRTFAGTLFFVSHDRTFVNLVASEIIEVRDASVMRYPGVYEDYVYHLQNQVRAELAEDDLSVAPAKKNESYQEKKRRESEERKVANRLAKTEAAIAALKDEREKLLAELDRNPGEVSEDKTNRYAELCADIDKQEILWLELQEGVLSAS